MFDSQNYLIYILTNNSLIMSRIEELKKQNPHYVIDTVDIINDLFEKTKYTEMVINLAKNKFSSSKNHINDLINELVHEYKFKREDLTLKSPEEISNIYRVINDFIGYNNFKTVKKFIELNERKLIINNDLTSYRTFDDLELQMSLAELKLIDKEMEKQIHKLYENDEWLVVKPLSFLASKKYGASTKWCTTQEHNPEYYLRYSRRGILIYCINKLTGDKVAAFKNLDETYEKETSFWNLIDQRIDSLESGLPIEVMNIIKDEFTTTKSSNWDILSDDEKNRQVLWIENEYGNIKKGYESPMTESMEEPMVEETMMEEVQEARIIPMPAIRNENIQNEAVNDDIIRRLSRLMNGGERMATMRAVPEDDGPMQAG